MSLYGIFKNKDNKTLVYYPVPKNANSSAKYFLAKHCGVDKNFKKVIDLNDPNSKIENDDVQSEKTKPAISSFLPSKQKFAVTDADIKACIIREPIDRFISAYTNRVLFRKDQGFFEHSIDMVIEKLRQGRFENKHFLPQTYFLGKNINYFNLICCMDSLKIFEDAVNQFFKNKIIFPWIETKSSKLKLSKKQRFDLKEIYADDEIFFSDYKKLINN
tara:strand:- start:74 stop:724 length:651 start_codon:yes stop_codon:yes gene_type:complete